MEPRSSSRLERRRRTAIRLVVVTMLTGLVFLPLLARQAQAAPMQGMAGMAALGGSMAPHAPVEVAVSPDLKRVLQGLLCQCGCNLDAYQCQQTMTCDVSSAMWDQGAKLVDEEGKSPEEALQLFAADYGEYVLASPTKQGFNLTAWILPFVALLVGGVVLAFALRGWRAAGSEVPQAPAATIDPRYLERIERELREEHR